MTETFNLVDEPWIEVIDHEGHESEISVWELLSNAGSYLRLASPLGTVNFAILRLLEAILYRSWDLPAWRNLDGALDHWEAKWDQDSLLDADVEKYLKTWHHRFDLRDAEAPFFQVADLRTAKNDWKKLDTLLPDAGDEGDLFTMRSDISSTNASEAARMVVHCMAYDYSGIKSGAVGDDRVKGGRGYPIGIGWAGWLGGTMLEGDNLKETLLFNYLPNRTEAGTDDLPQWELPPLTSARRTEPIYNLDKPEQNGATGQVELLTWPQRRIRLRWEGDRVTGVLITNGDPVGYTNKNGLENMTPWRFSEPQSKKAKAPVYMPRALDAGRAMWRSIDGILPNQSVEQVKSKFADQSEAFLPAESVVWIGRLVSEDVLPKDKVVRLHMVSMSYGAQSSSFGEVVEDSLTVASPLLAVEGEGLRAAARLAVGLTDDVAKQVGTFYRNIIFAVSGETQTDTTDVRGRFFSAVDPLFRHWLRGLPEAGEPQQALARWREALSGIATDIADEILSQQGPAVWVGRWNQDRGVRVTGANSMFWFRRSLRRLLESIDPDDDGTLEPELETVGSNDQ